jgi:hypothetical protein
MPNIAMTLVRPKLRDAFRRLIVSTSVARDNLTAAPNTVTPTPLEREAIELWYHDLDLVLRTIHEFRSDLACWKPKPQTKQEHSP